MASSVSLEQLAALNDELAALAGSGLPLERGLRQLSPELPSQMRGLMDELSRRLENGEPLLQVLADPALGIPAAYRVVLEAGLRSGQLGRALQNVADTARRVGDIRRGIMMASIYPLLVATVAYAALLACTLWFIPEILGTFESITETPPTSWQWLDAVCRSTHLWAPWPPVIAILLLVAGYWRGTRLPVTLDRGTRILGRRVAGPRQILALSQLATMLDLLGLLLEHKVPLADALELATSASDVRSWRMGGQQLATELRAGQPFNQESLEKAGLPASLGWLVHVSTSSAPVESHGIRGRDILCATPLSAVESAPIHGLSESALREAADSCRRRADQSIEWFTRSLPLWMCIGAGLFFVLPVFLLLFLPWIDLLSHLMPSS